MTIVKHFAKLVGLSPKTRVLHGVRDQFPGLQTWLVVWNINFLFPYIGNFIIPIDVHIFQRGGPTTNQKQPWVARTNAYASCSCNIFTISATKTYRSSSSSSSMALQPDWSSVHWFTLEKPIEKTMILICAECVRGYSHDIYDQPHINPRWNLKREVLVDVLDWSWGMVSRGTKRFG